MKQKTYKKIPIGNTIKVRWPIKTNGRALPLVGRTLFVQIIDPRGIELPMTFSITDGNVITFTYEGRLQKLVGIYWCELYESRYFLGQARIDKAAFEIVPHSEQACEGEDDNLQISYEVELEGSEIAALMGAPYIQEGYWYIDGQNLGVRAEGQTPYIQDGYWYIGDEPTGQPAFAVPRFDEETGEIVYEV